MRYIEPLDKTIAEELESQPADMTAERGDRITNLQNLRNSISRLDLHIETYFEDKNCFPFSMLMYQLRRCEETGCLPQALEDLRERLEDYRQIAVVRNLI